ncbi:hypothetical protein EHQ43_18530 [Leptospira bouyouniensis]|uniref:Uncharacterized protein n=1 Tax=Leptospira bouyouniensis TaxID=2484911 RepID=A0A7I0HMG7_9LEPT|nr:hypothetical protein [Leptospira bouyouniensis]TGL01900.1 hypothetical protein EHQ43_18530 [Leptospira bouyouniensis]
MNNWFEHNQTKSIIAYTLLIAASSISATYFIIDQQKVEILQSKISFLERESDSIRKENDYLRRLLNEIPNAIPFLINKNKELSDQIYNFKRETQENKINNENTDIKDSEYSVKKRKKVGVAYLDPKTNISFCVTYINYSREGTITLSPPNDYPFTIKNISAGYSWNYNYKGKKYKIFLLELDYIASEYEFELKEYK